MKNIYAAAGSAFHKVPEMLYKAKHKPAEWREYAAANSLDAEKPDAYRIHSAEWRRQLSEASLQEDDNLFSAGQKMVGIYLRSTDQRVPKSVEREFWAEYPAPGEDAIALLHGFFDVEYESSTEEEPSPRDWKTSYSRMSKDEAQSDPQVLLYAWVTHSETGNYPYVAIHHARSGVDVVVQPKDFYALDYHIRQLLARLGEFSVSGDVDEVFPKIENAAPSKKPCTYCDFKKQCLGGE